MSLGTAAPTMVLRNAVRRLVLDPLLAAAFPTSCVACRLPLDEPSRGVLCPRCLDAVPRFGASVCPCGTPMTGRGLPGPADGLCGRCRRGLGPWSRGACIGPFDGSLRLAIHALKYGGRMGLARTLAAVLLESPAALHVLDGAAFIVPVPLHRGKEKARGFNQSALIAQAIGARCGVASRAGVLVRSRETTTQTGLTAFARRRNVAGAFAAAPNEVRGATIVLVDDVITTGATAMACAAALRSAGASEVRLLTLARVA